jgi:hypothetical protein
VPSQLSLLIRFNPPSIFALIAAKMKQGAACPTVMPLTFAAFSSGSGTSLVRHHLHRRVPPLSSVIFLPLTRLLEAREALTETRLDAWMICNPLDKEADYA